MTFLDHLKLLFKPHKKKQKLSVEKRLLSRAMPCHVCSGHGYFDMDETGKTQLHPLVPWGSKGTTQVGCSNCGGNETQRGSGEEWVQFYVSDALCLYCTGKGHIERTQEKHYTGFDGRTHRKTETLQETCPACFGTLKKIHRTRTFPCSQCQGLGEISVWEKARFGDSEVEVERKCPRCNGVGQEERIEQFAWKHEFPPVRLADQVEI